MGPVWGLRVTPGSLAVGAHPWELKVTPGFLVGGAGPQGPSGGWPRTCSQVLGGHSGLCRCDKGVLVPITVLACALPSQVSPHVPWNRAETQYPCRAAAAQARAPSTSSPSPGGTGILSQTLGPHPGSCRALGSCSQGTGILSWLMWGTGILTAMSSCVSLCPSGVSTVALNAPSPCPHGVPAVALRALSPCPMCAPCPCRSSHAWGSATHSTQGARGVRC